MCPIPREGFFVRVRCDGKNVTQGDSPQRCARRLFAGLNHIDAHNTRLFTVTDGEKLTGVLTSNGHPLRLLVAWRRILPGSAAHTHEQRVFGRDTATGA